MDNYVVVVLQRIMSKHLPTLRFNTNNPSIRGGGESADTEKLVLLRGKGSFSERVWHVAVVPRGNDVDATQKVSIKTRCVTLNTFGRG